MNRVLLLTAICSLACGSLPDHAWKDADCGCLIKTPAVKYSTMDDLDDGQFIEIANVVGDMYIIVRWYDKSIYEVPTSAESVLDAQISYTSWTPPATSSLQGNPVTFREIDGLPAVGRYAWLEMDDGTKLAYWAEVIEAPDRFYAVLTWGLEQDQATNLPELRDIVATFERTANLPSTNTSMFPGVGVRPQERKPLLDARREFTTAAASSRPPQPGPPVPQPPEGWSAIQYSSPIGEMAAMVTDDPGDGKRHPAVLWAHGGFRGLDDTVWRPGAPPTEDVGVGPFVDKGIVVMAPSWRGEHDNPGQFGMFWGEVEDLLAAREHLKSLPYVDPERVYLGGHNAGATLVLLAATTGEGHRAAFSSGGVADMEALHERFSKGWGNTPYPPQDKRENQLRSAARFADGITRPTFYFEGELSTYHVGTESMQASATASRTPFEAHLIARADHWSHVKALNTLIAEKIVADTGPTAQIGFTDAELAMIARTQWVDREAEIKAKVGTWVASRLREGFLTNDEIETRAITGFEEYYPYEALMQISRDVVAEAFRKQRLEQAAWPAVTDVDRLDKAFEALGNQGFVTRQNWDDCTRCAWASISHAQDDWIESGNPYSGEVFYTQPDLTYVASDGALYLSFGGDVGGDEATAEAGRKIAAALRAEGLNVEWDGNPGTRIVVRMDWQKRR